MKNKTEIEQLVINSEKVVGIKQVLKGIINDTLRCVVVSEDCDSNIKEKIIAACNDKNVQVKAYPSMKEMGKICQIEVAAAVVGLLK